MNFFDKVPISNIPLETLVEQVAVHDWNLFSKITEDQVIAFCKTPTNKLAYPELERLHRWNEKLITWVCADTLRLELKERVERLKFWIQFCDNSIKLSNLNSPLQVLRALQHPCIARLEKTWNELSREMLNIFSKAKEFYESSYKFYYERYSNKPLVPSLFIFLKEYSENLKNTKDEKHDNKEALLVLETIRKHRYTSIQFDPRVQPLFTIEWESIDAAKGVFEFWSVICEERKKLSSPPVTKKEQVGKFGSISKIFSRDRSNTVI